MPILNDIFSSDDSDSTSNTDVTGILENTVGLDANSSSESYDRDEDGNESHDSSDQGLSLDSDTGGLLDAVSDATSSSDESDIG